jgi:hypothetical protein
LPIAAALNIVVCRGHDLIKCCVVQLPVAAQWLGRHIDDAICAALLSLATLLGLATELVEHVIMPALVTIGLHAKALTVLFFQQAILLVSFMACRTKAFAVWATPHILFMARRTKAFAIWAAPHIKVRTCCVV